MMIVMEMDIMIIKMKMIYNEGTYTRSTWMMMIVMEEDMMIKIEMMITIMKLIRIERILSFPPFSFQPPPSLMGSQH